MANVADATPPRAGKWQPPQTRTERERAILDELATFAAEMPCWEVGMRAVALADRLREIRWTTWCGNCGEYPRVAGDRLELCETCREAYEDTAELDARETALSDALAHRSPSGAWI